MKIHAITYARSSLPESMVLSGGSQDKRLAISFLLYVIETENRKILIDAGCDSLPGFELTNFTSPAKALTDYGISPDKITNVIITHAHHDHIDGLHYFPQAHIHIHTDEYQKGRHYFPNVARVHTFRKKSAIDGQVLIRHIGGHTAGSCIVQVEIDDTKYIFGGDECYLPICLEQNIPTGVSFDPAVSRKFISRFRKPGYRVLLAHDTNIQTGMITERI